MEPPRPPVTVSTPGGPPSSRHEPAPGPEHELGASRRVTAALAAGAVLVGLLVAVSGRGDDAPDDASADAPDASGRGVPLVVPQRVPGVAAMVSLGPAPGDRLLVQPLRVEVELSPVGRGVPGAPPPSQTDVELQAVTARGFAVRLDGPPLPRVLADTLVLAEPRTVVLDVEAVVSDCSVEPQAQRQLVLRVRSRFTEGSVRAVVQPEVVRALDRLVSRTCRRPRG